MGLADVVTIEDVFSNEQCEKIWHLPNLPSWYWGNYSHHKEDGLFWKLNLEHDPFFTEELFEQIISKVKVNNLFIVDTTDHPVYANGHTFGTQGGIHKDSDVEGNYTFLYYANPTWYNEWGGSTVWIDEKGNHKSIYPKPNTGVFFPGTLLHYADATNKTFNGLRVTVAWKVGSINN